MLLGVPINVRDVSFKFYIKSVLPQNSMHTRNVDFSIVYAKLRSAPKSLPQTKNLQQIAAARGRVLRTLRRDASPMRAGLPIQMLEQLTVPIPIPNGSPGEVQKTKIHAFSARRLPERRVGMLVHWTLLTINFSCKAQDQKFDATPEKRTLRLKKSASRQFASARAISFLQRTRTATAPRAQKLGHALPAQTAQIKNRRCDLKKIISSTLTSRQFWFYIRHHRQYLDFSSFYPNVYKVRRVTHATKRFYKQAKIYSSKFLLPSMETNNNSTM